MKRVFSEALSLVWNKFSHTKILSLPLPLSISGISPVAVCPVDAHLAELEHYMQRETDALVLAKDVVKQLEGISSLDQKALAEVGHLISFVFF